MPLQGPSEIVAGELAALVGIEDLGTAVTSKRFLECIDTKIGAERVGQSPRQHRSAHPVHDDHQVERAFGHRDVGNVRAPYLIDPLDRDPTEEVRVDLVSRCRFARVRAWIDRYQSQQPHQASDPFAIDDMALRRQPRRHPPRAVIRPSQILPIDQRHHCKICGVHLGRLPVDCRARHRQQPALLRYRQRRLHALDYRAPFRQAHLPSFRAKKIL